METKPTLGLIGLGIMGRAMARNLLKAGYALTVHDMNRAAVDELVAEGAVAGTSPRDAPMDRTSASSSWPCRRALISTGWRDRPRSLAQRRDTACGSSPPGVWRAPAEADDRDWHAIGMD